MEKQDATPHEDSLKKRYVSRVLSNTISFVIGIATIGIVPRSLGPVLYGNYQFLKSFFEYFQSFFDLGTSTCFQVKYSARPEEKLLSAFFFKYVLLAVAAMFLTVAGVFLLSFGGKMWPGQEMNFVFLALGMAVLSFLSLNMLVMVDAHGLTVKAEIYRIVLGIVVTAVLLLMYHYRVITLRNYFLFQYFNFGALFAGLWGLLRRTGKAVGVTRLLPRSELKKYAKEFFTFVHPLVTYQLIASGALLAQRWMLQLFGGSAQQGFYGLSYSVSAVCAMFSGSMTSLITREFSVAWQVRNLEKMAALFRRYVPLLFSITAYFSCFVCVQADLIVAVVGGERYQGALLPIRIMALFPLLQTYGQLGGSVLLATERTKLHRNIGAAGLLASLAAAWFLLAPTRLLGLGAGAAGLAICTVGLSFITVNAQLYYNAKFLRMPFYWYFLHQVLSTLLFILLAAAARQLTSFCLGHSSGNIIISFLLSGVLYTLIAAALFHLFPGIFGLNRDDVRDFIARLRNYLPHRK